MKVLVFVKATPNSEKGIPAPTEELQKMFNDMGKFNEKLVKAGVMQEADGLKPSSFGKRLRFSGSDTPTVIDGPFAETKELVAGYWIWTVKSVEEAVEWAKQCPNPMPGEEGVLEIRPTFSMEEFDELATPEITERNQRLEKEMARRKKAKAKVKTKVKTKAKESPARRSAARKKPKPTRARSRK
jgi:hypothetical protein